MAQHKSEDDTGVKSKEIWPKIIKVKVKSLYLGTFSEVHSQEKSPEPVSKVKFLRFGNKLNYFCSFKFSYKIEKFNNKYD